MAMIWSCPALPKKWQLPSIATEKLAVRRPPKRHRSTAAATAANGHPQTPRECLEWGAPQTIAEFNLLDKLKTGGPEKPRLQLYFDHRRVHPF
jgi:hypothetical protein